MKEIVKKFGGSSVENLSELRKIISCKDVVVVSALGKGSGDSYKVTDLLDMVYQGLKNGRDITSYWEAVKRRFVDFDCVAKSNLDLNEYFKEIENNFSPNISRDYLLSRGEYLTATILAKAFGMKLVDPSLIIKLKNGQPDLSISVPLIRKMIVANTIVPGFYGAENGRIKTLDRNGSDITGAVLAHALKSKEYQKYTNVDGVKMTLPEFGLPVRRIDNISYKNMQAFAENGANILHPEAIKICRQSKTPIKIKSIYNKDDFVTNIGKENDCKFIKAMGTKKQVLRISTDKDLNKVDMAELISFFENCGMKYQTNNKNNLYFIMEQEKTDEFFKQLEKTVAKQFGVGIKTLPMSEVVLIVGNRADANYVLYMMQKYANANRFDTDCMKVGNNVVVALPQYDLKNFYSGVFNHIASQPVNEKDRY